MFDSRNVSFAYNFTDRARGVLAAAREEAIHLGGGLVAPEHLLLALIHQGGGISGTVIAGCGLTPAQLVEAVKAAIRTAPGNPAPGHPPYTATAQRVLEYAAEEARAMHCSYVGTEHLLLGLLRDTQGTAANVLHRFGLTLERAREEVVRLSGSGPTRAFAIRIDENSGDSIYEQIVQQVEEAVATGELRPGDRLPPVRRLADELDIAPGTVARAYGELERRGVLVTEGARGTRVAEYSRSATPAAERWEVLVGLLRPVTVAAARLGATAEEVRRALERAMRGIFDKDDRSSTT